MVAINEYKSLNINSNVKTLLKDYYKEFQHWYLSEKALFHSDSTKKMLIPLLFQFDKYLFLKDSTMTIEDLNTHVIEEYKIFLIDTLKNKPKTVRKKTRVIKLFCNYLFKKGYVKEDYFKIVNPKDENKLSEHMNEEQIRLLLSEFTNHRYGIRDILITKIMLMTGCELSSVLGMNLSDIELNDNNFRLYIKGYSNKKEAAWYQIDSYMVNLFRRYLALRRELVSVSTNTSSLFLNTLGSPYSARGFQTNFKQAIIAIDTTFKFTPRNLRTTFLYNLAKYVDEQKLQIIAKQKNVKHYYNEEIQSNPLNNIHI